MNFSYEELYNTYGQYDMFVVLIFHWNSESYNKYGERLMGVFKYTLERRKELERTIRSEHVPRSSKRTQFTPSLHLNLTDEQKIDLDRDGILNDDIAQVLAFDNSPRKNAFTQKGNKELPNPHKIKINLSEKEGSKLMLRDYKIKLKNKDNLIQIERDYFYALRLYFEPESITEEERDLWIKDDGGNTKTSIRKKLLETKWAIEGLSENEKTEVKDILEKQCKRNKEILKREVQRSNINWTDLPLTLIGKLIALACSFEDEVLIAWHPPIWWDLERYLHIYIRHTSDLQHGNFKEKTAFQYDFKTTRRLIIAVLKSADKEIKAEFTANPTKNFKRHGNRALCYQGNYYNVEIEPTGRLLTFHPYNGD